MTFWNNVIVVSIVVAIAAGQVLFKLAANSMQTAGGIFQMPVLVPLFSAFAVYGTATLAWVWVLQFIDLSRAYPFMAIAFVLVPAASWMIFGERIDTRYVIGVIFICGGVALVGRG